MEAAATLKIAMFDDIINSKSDKEKTYGGLVAAAHL